MKLLMPQFIFYIQLTDKADKADMADKADKTEKRENFILIDLLMRQIRNS